MPRKRLKKLNFALVKKPLTVFLKADLQTVGLEHVANRGEQRRARDDGDGSSSRNYPPLDGASGVAACRVTVIVVVMVVMVVVVVVAVVWWW